MRERQDEFDRLNVSILVVTFEAGPIARAYVAQTRLPWPVAVDPDRSLYATYGMGKARWWKFINPAAIWYYLKIILRGNRVRRPTGDIKQLGGNVIVDPQGLVRLHQVAEGPAGRPSIEEMLATIH